MSLAPKHYLWLGNLLVLGLMVWSAVSLGLSVLTHGLEISLSRHRTIEINEQSGPALRPLAQYETIAGQDIFGAGKGESSTSTPEENGVKAQTEGGGLRLRGTIVDVDTGFAAVILEDIKSQEQNLYRPGDYVGEAEIIQIDRDSVTLSQGNQTIRLKIYQEELAELPWGQAKTSEETGKDAEIARAVGPNRFIVSRDVLGEQMENLNALMAKVRIAPYFKEGQPHGFRVASLQRESPLYEMGLRRGDVIVSVNGVSARNPEDLVNLYRQVQQLDSVTLEIERQGKPATIFYALR